MRLAQRIGPDRRPSSSAAFRHAPTVAENAHPPLFAENVRMEMANAMRNVLDPTHLTLSCTYMHSTAHSSAN